MTTSKKSQGRIEIDLDRLQHPHSSDNRLTPAFGPIFWCERKSERKWHHCKYCCHNVPTFLLDVGVIGSQEVIQTLRCCWECGSGLDSLKENIAETRRLIALREQALEREQSR